MPPHVPISGSSEVTLAALTVAPAAPPYTYLGMARQFAAGASSLATLGSANAVSVSFLAAQSVECALKAFLSRSGDDTRLKKSPLRHDLVALWALAAQEGLFPLAAHPSWLATLARLHGRPYYLRYSTGVHGLVLPSVQPMTNELDQLINQVHVHLHAP